LLELIVELLLLPLVSLLDSIPSKTRDTKPICPRFVLEVVFPMIKVLSVIKEIFDGGASQ